MSDVTESKRELLVAEMLRFFGETNAVLRVRSEIAVATLAPSILRELAGSLKSLEVVIHETNSELRAALLPAAEGGTSAEPVLDRALASLEQLNEVTGAMMRKLDEMLTA